ncbi:hypothetical protein VPNG_02586 [Cytospora leucostoma]|uniref:Uncharacterized protein n=1 Tax=Cytospora leucostoma TaxID=1230097 RepID=A0A423XI07_9PEZI|nr:hypothetical protein VPNG_02586 [Cytospora leucostoma]
MDTDKEKLPPLLKLFGHDPEGKLKTIRDQIYSYVWSRDRRDEAKLDWVLSQYGVNRNVPERFIDDAPSDAAYKSIKELRCGLILANREVSADFARYIYSTNELEIDVDLKASHTALNETKLHKLLTLLHNPNFARYSRMVRVRIHFPDKYPLQDLPAFNQRALEDIATTLDGFEQIQKLDVRIVPMQGPQDYELRFAIFPFYPMSFTDWSISMLNDTTLNWVIAGRQQVYRLDQAWDIYQATGCLTVRVAMRSVENKSVPHGRVTEEKTASLLKNYKTPKNKNGSQKRRDRKKRAASDTDTDTESDSATPTIIASSRASSPVPTPTQHDRTTFLPGTELLEGHIEHQSELSDRELSLASYEEHPSASELPASESFAVCTASPSQPPAPPPSPSNLPKVDPAVDKFTSGTNSEVVMTPPVSSVASSEDHDTIAIILGATNVDGVVEPTATTEVNSPKTSLPPSPVLSPTAQGGIHAVEPLSAATMVSREAVGFTDEQDNDPKPKKKRGNRKKSKKSKTADTTSVGINDGGQLDNNETDVGQNDIGPTQENQVGLEGLEEPQSENEQCFVQYAERTAIRFSELVDLQPFVGAYCIGTMANNQKLIMVKTREAERHLRHRARLAANQLEKEVENSKAKKKRQLRKANQILMRRRGPSGNFRRVVEYGRHQCLPTTSSDPRPALIDYYYGDENTPEDRHHHTTPSRNFDPCLQQDVLLSTPSANNSTPIQTYMGVENNNVWMFPTSLAQVCFLPFGNLVPTDEGHYQGGHVEEQIEELDEPPDSEASMAQLAADDGLSVPRGDGQTDSEDCLFVS